MILKHILLGLIFLTGSLATTADYYSSGQIELMVRGLLAKARPPTSETTRTKTTKQTRFQLNVNHNASLPTTINMTVKEESINCLVRNIVLNNGHRIAVYKNQTLIAFFIEKANTPYGYYLNSPIELILSHDKSNITLKMPKGNSVYDTYQCSLEIYHDNEPVKVEEGEEGGEN